MSASLLGEILALAMFAVTLLAVMIGFPVAFTLAGIGLLFALIGHGLGVFDMALLTGLASRYFGTMVNETLVAVPLFVFMGVVLERARIAQTLLETVGELFGPLRGGLGIAVVLVGMLLAASTGIVGATVVTMGLLSLPAMQRAGYDPKLSSGIICASGTLGQIIPPSTVLIFLGDMLQGANQQAQLARGNFAPEPLSVGQLFAGALLPGLMLAGLYIGWVLVKAIIDPTACPALRPDPAARAGLARRVMVGLLPPLLLILAVLGSILAGIATPTESASVGAVGALLLAFIRGEGSLPMLRSVMDSTVRISAMVFTILLGASVFSLVFRGLGGEELVADAMAALPGGRWAALALVMALMFLLGFFLDTFEIIFIIVPIAAPILIGLGIDPLWLGIMIGVNLQTSFLTPPFGFALFYLRGVAGAYVTTGQIYRGIVPFVGLQLVALLLLVLMPSLATWLPDRLFTTSSPAASREASPVGPDEPLAPASPRDFDDLFLPPEQQRQPPPGPRRFDDLFR